MSFITSTSSITLEASIPNEILEYINSLLLLSKDLNLDRELPIENIFKTIIENLYYNRYKKLLDNKYLGKNLTPNILILATNTIYLDLNPRKASNTTLLRILDSYKYPREKISKLELLLIKENIEFNKESKYKISRIKIPISILIYI